MQELVIVIPVYKETLTHNQSLSINQCFKILGRYRITLACPTGFDAAHFVGIAKRYGKELTIEEFEPSYFANIAGYNRLMLSVEFYSRFSEFEYLLIYQNDAYVFTDQLEKWSQSKYDYIGAPWFEGWISTEGVEKIIGAGNGGLSLRNVPSFLKILKKIERLTGSINLFYRQPILRNIPIRYIGRIIALLNNLSRLNIVELVVFNNCSKTCGSYLHNEDYFWGALVPSYFAHFKVAKPEVAMYFSFENHPRQLFELTNHQLPFGCHAWERYDPEFWSDFIKV